MDLPIAVHNVEVKLTTIRKHIQYAIDDLEPVENIYKSKAILERLLDRMDLGTDVVDSPVPNRMAGDLSAKEELTYIKNITLTKNRENYHV